MKVDYGKTKVKAFKVLSGTKNAMSVRTLCVYSGVPYRVMAVSVKKWLQQGMLVKETVPDLRRWRVEVGYSLASTGLAWLKRHSVMYGNYLLELYAWQAGLTSNRLDYWETMAFNDFERLFDGVVVGVI